MQLPIAEDLLRNAETFNIAFGNVIHMHMSVAYSANNASEYNMTIQRDNISTYLHSYNYVVWCMFVFVKGSKFNSHTVLSFLQSN